MLQPQVPLAPLTTFKLGGPARWFARISSLAELREALRFARDEGLPVFVLGQGSNTVVADAGFDGVVLHWGSEGLRWSADGLSVTVDAGVSFDALVASAVGRGLAGLEALSGIPGQVGAAPVQNIGAYGQEAADTVEAVEVVNAAGERELLGPEDCGFGYRTSRFKGARAGDLVVAVTFRLKAEAARLGHGELVRAFPEGARPTPAEVREVVLGLRRGKGMLIDPADPNHRSAGSFFMNPVVSPTQAVTALNRGAPHWPVADGQIKLSAAWLIEQAGMPKGFGEGPVGLSTRHTLALVNRGGATAAQLVRFAAQVRGRVAEVFGVSLTPEPVFVGFGGLNGAEVLARLTGEDVGERGGQR